MYPNIGRNATQGAAARAKNGRSGKLRRAAQAASTMTTPPQAAHSARSRYQTAAGGSPDAARYTRAASA